MPITHLFKKNEYETVEIDMPPTYVTTKGIIIQRNNIVLIFSNIELSSMISTRNEMVAAEPIQKQKIGTLLVPGTGGGRQVFTKAI
jgi:hypothetical protein